MFRVLYVKMYQPRPDCVLFLSLSKTSSNENKDVFSTWKDRNIDKEGDNILKV